MLAHRALAQTTYDSKEAEQLDVPACLYFSHHTHTVLQLYIYVCVCICVSVKKNVPMPSYT